MYRRTIAVVALLALVAAGCASGGSAKRKAVGHPVFPEEDELSQIEEAPPPEQFFDKRRASVREWKLVGDLPDTLGVADVERDNAWNRALAGAVATRDRIVASEGMDCLARQFAAFHAEHDAFPGGSLRSFIRARCGVVAEGLSYQWWTRDGKLPEAEHASQAGKIVDEAEKGLLGKFGGGHYSVGIGHAGGAEESLTVIARGERRVEVEPIALQQPGGTTVDVRGRVFDQVDRIFARVTSGAFGTERCRTVDKVEPPKFHIRCTIDAESDWTAADLSTSREREPLASTILRPIFWKTEADARTYRIQKTGRALVKTYQEEYGAEEAASEEKGAGAEAKAESTDGAAPKKAAGESNAAKEPKQTTEKDSAKPARTAAEQFIHLVNGVRQEAGMPKLTLQKKQSEEVRRLASRYFQGSEAGNSRMLRSKIALGLMAGWKVDGDIIDAGFGSQTSSAAAPETLLQQFLATPSGRQLLLRADYDRLAAAILKAQSSSGLGLLAVSYKPPEQKPHHDRIDQALATINQTRDERGAPDLTHDESLDAKADVLARSLESGEIGLRDAQKKLLEHAANTWKTRVRAYVMVGQSLDDFTVADILAGARVSRASLVVAPYRPVGAAWKSYAIIVVFRGSDQSQIVDRRKAAESPERAALN